MLQCLRHERAFKKIKLVSLAASLLGIVCQDLTLVYLCTSSGTQVCTFLHVRSILCGLAGKVAPVDCNVSLLSVRKKIVRSAVVLLCAKAIVLKPSSVLWRCVLQ